MSGQLIGIVGPSGVGKDSIMYALADARPELSLVKRCITRAPELGGEDYNPVSDIAFEEMVRGDAFCLHWRAHDLRYGVPRSVVDDVKNGQDLLVNLSRSVLVEAQDKFDHFIVLNITASAETVRNRLQQRGRESEAEIEKRLTRLNFPLPQGVDPISICNNSTLKEAVDAALHALYPVNA